YCDAAQFCNWLSREEGIPAEQHCYHQTTRLPAEPVTDHRNRKGYRLMTEREFERAGRAGATTPRFYGTTIALLRHYAWYEQKDGLRAHPVARLKPNDLGLFDTLGNILEICQSSDPMIDPRNQATLCGGSFYHSDFNVTCAMNIPRRA